MLNSGLSSLIRSENIDRSFVFFSFVMFSLLFIRFIVNHSTCLTVLVIVIPYTLIIESVLKDVMNKMATSSSYFNVTPYYVLPWSIGLLAISSALFFFMRPPFPIDGALGSTYLYSLFISTTLFSICSSLKGLLIGTGLVNFKFTRRGFFGVFQRFFILMNNIIVTYPWVCYFSSNMESIGVLSVFTMKKSISCLLYVVCKCFVLLFLLWDLCFSLRNYSANALSAYRQANIEEIPEECVICQAPPEEPVTLTCGHVFCYQCAYQWLSEHSTCPLCRAKISEAHNIEFADGYMPVSCTFCSF